MVRPEDAQTSKEAQKSAEPDKSCLKELPPNLTYIGEFFQDAAIRLKWGDLSEDEVMDVGCGVDSLKLFKTVFPRFRKVIAIDISLSYINYLKFYRAHGRMDYRVADISSRCTLLEWENKMSKVVSFYCFNCLKDQKAGFENINYVLKPGGEAIILTALKNPHYQCAKHLFETPKWKLYQHLERQFTDHQAHATGIGFYEKILGEIGFEVIVCSEELKFIPFSTEEAFRASELTKDKVIVQHLPPNVQEEFKEDYIQALILLNGRSPSGELCIKTSSAKILLRKIATAC